MLTPRTKRYFLKLLPFGVVPFVFALIYNLIEKGILGDHPVYPSTGNPYNFNPIVPSLISMVLGLFIGMVEVGILSKVFKKRGFIEKFIWKTLIYFLMILGATFIIATVSNAINLGVSPFSAQVWDNFMVFFLDFALWSVMLYFMLGIVFCLFYAEISDNVGQNVLLNFFTGKYHHPVEEKRVFLFLDMKSSTTIAEQLGHTAYFELLRDYYADLTNAIIAYSGEIYQYVGDEVVVTWKWNPKKPDTRCLDCFFAMQSALVSRADYYMKKFGVAPSFKAGVHLGKVTTGEIGQIKKDLVFTGDVLNTTARIQGLCNDYGVALLLSKDLVDPLRSKDVYSFKELGETQLRGRDEKIALFTI